MTGVCRAESRFFEAAHKTAADLHRLGFIDERRTQKYDALCREVSSLPRIQHEGKSRRWEPDSV